MKDHSTLADHWGVSTQYQNFRGETQRVPEETVERLITSMGGSESPPKTARKPIRRSSCYLPRGLRTWGWSVQLYAARSLRSWGIGDLADLREIGIWASSMGAEMLMINPLHAPAPTKPQQPSPYYPSTRVYRNPLYLRIEEIPGSEDSGIDDLAAEGRALNLSPRIDRDAIFDLKTEALERIWAMHKTDDAFDDYISQEGSTLLGYARHCVKTEKRGGMQADDGDRIRFHQWVQWLIDQQLEGASKEIGLVTDLAIGVDPAGADAWMWRDSFVKGVSIGAPPDDFNGSGQDWGLPPINPWKLQESSFEPFTKTLMSAFRHARGLRIDHVMGLFRQFWVPSGMSPKEGGYVRYPDKNLLQIAARESRHHKALVIGEDLGNVEPRVREEMRTRKMLSQKVLWFERHPPSSWPHLSMASVNNHDMATVAGLWSGRDLEVQRRFRGEVSEQFHQELIGRLSNELQIGPSSPIPDVTLALHDHIGKAPSAIAFASLEDAAGASERPNLPGTMRPDNWSLGLPISLEELFESRLAADIAQVLSRR
jgi:4-alpha-glucanotransferase